MTPQEALAAVDEDLCRSIPGLRMLRKILDRIEKEGLTYRSNSG